MTTDETKSSQPAQPASSSADVGSPAGDAMKMQADEFSDLRKQADGIADRDVAVGRMFHAILLHLGHLHGFDPAQEDARAHIADLEAQRQQEDAQLKATAEARVQARAVEDAQVLTPDQAAQRTTARQQEDEQLETQAKEREQARADEDTQAQAAVEETQ